MTSTEKATHTPGPWTIEDRDYIYGSPSTTIYGNRVAKVFLIGEPVEHPSDPDRDFPEAEANAHLIAAAPALLEAAEAALAYFAVFENVPGTGFGHAYSERQHARALRAAIAAAKGEQSCYAHGQGMVATDSVEHAGFGFDSLPASTYDHSNLPAAEMNARDGVTHPSLPFGPHLTQAEVDLTLRLLNQGLHPDEILNEILSLRVADDDAELQAARDRVRERRLDDERLAEECHRDAQGDEARWAAEYPR